MLLPLTAQKDVTLGTLGVFWRRPVDEPNEEQLAMIEELAAMAGRALQNARRFHEVFELSVRDPLTGLHNRHYFHETLAHEVQRAHRYDRRLALIFFDIDDFKAINEELGHLGGDAVLEEAGAAPAFGRPRRGHPLPCRRRRVRRHPARVVDRGSRAPVPAASAGAAGPADRPRPGAFELSAGIAELGRDDDATSFFWRVDQALYRAKRSGKGTVVAAEDSAE